MAIRWSTSSELLGLPLVSVALGPSGDGREARGIARGIVAIGDVAVGGISVGGVAIGFVSLGGASFGLISLGGLSIGLIAVGGLAIGAVAIGGMAIGYYALGGGAIGVHVLSAAERSTGGVEFFGRWFPWILRLPENAFSTTGGAQSIHDNADLCIRTGHDGQGGSITKITASSS